MFKKQAKTFATIATDFTSQFQQHADSQKLEAKKQEKLEAAARLAKERAVREQTQAENAVDNLKQLLGA